MDTEDDFDQVFAELCHRYDTPEWDIGNLRRALEAEIAERADVSIHAVSIALDGHLVGNVGQLEAPVREGLAQPTGQEIESPNPVPLPGSFVEKKGSKTREASSSGMPMP